MKSELVVDVQSSEITTAFVEDGRLAEINREPRDMNWSVGNIYFGRIKKIMPALNAAFVDIGHEKDAFLHYLDLGSQFSTVYDYTNKVVTDKKHLPPFPKAPTQTIVGKMGSIEDVLKVGQDILVQIQKEPINTKGSRLTAEISIAGRYLVLIPFNDKIMVSGKIKSETEKKRLRNLVQSIKPKGYGVIIRTVAADVQLQELQREMNVLYKRWEDVILKLQKAQPVSLISAEIGRTIGIIRDVFNSSFDHIYVNDRQMYSEILDYVELIAPESKNIVTLYDGDQPIFDHFDITRQTKTGLGRTVSFKYGGYLVMDKTEALFVIDVNSGTRKVGETQEENAMNMNLAAADEIAHQLRLRDIGGIIVIDFIDLSNADNRQKLYEYMRHLMSRDRAKHNVLPLSKFGLMQITRQRVRPAVEIDIDEVCPTCHGKGHIQSSILFSDQLEQTIIQMFEKYGRQLKLYVHPYVYSYLSKGWIFSMKWHWRFRYGLQLFENQSLGFLEYQFFDSKGQQLKVEQPEQTPKKLVFEEEKPLKKQDATIKPVKTTVENTPKNSKDVTIPKEVSTIKEDTNNADTKQKNEATKQTKSKANKKANKALSVTDKTALKENIKSKEKNDVEADVNQGKEPSGQKTTVVKKEGRKKAEKSKVGKTTDENTKPEPVDNIETTTKKKTRKKTANKTEKGPAEETQKPKTTRQKTKKAQTNNQDNANL